jgi:hypothetical protein
MYSLASKRANAAMLLTQKKAQKKSRSFCRELHREDHFKDERESMPDSQIQRTSIA